MELIRSTRSSRLIWMLVAVLALLASTSVASAQTDECYPDGCTPPTDPPAEVEITCELETGSGESGDEVALSVVGAGSGTVRALLGGIEVSRSDGPAGAADDANTRSLAFLVPDLDPGVYTVVAVGDDFTVECTFEGQGGFSVFGDVLGAELVRDRAPGAVDGAVSSSSEGAGRLAFTGADLLRLALFALVALVVGAVIVRATRRRRLARL